LGLACLEHWYMRWLSHLRGLSGLSKDVLEKVNSLFLKN